jgi:hypothetical protein
MITDDRLRHLSSSDYAQSEPGQIAAELLVARERIAKLEGFLRRMLPEGIEQTCDDCGGSLGVCLKAMADMWASKSFKNLKVRPVRITPIDDTN